MVARHYIVKGRVQGVGFRYFTHRLAEQLDIKGWVKNLGNGAVEVHGEGDENPMEQFLSKIKRGPSLASVQDVETGEVEPEGYQGFSIEW